MFEFRVLLCSSTEVVATLLSSRVLIVSVSQFSEGVLLKTSAAFDSVIVSQPLKLLFKIKFWSVGSKGEEMRGSVMLEWICTLDSQLFC